MKTCPPRQASTDSGHVQQFDVRREGKPVWTLGAHSASVNGLSLSSQCPGCLVTVSSDKALKVWDVASQSGRPECVLEREMNLGELHSVDGCPDAPFVVCAGGDLPRDNLRVWDVREAADGEHNRFTNTFTFQKKILIRLFSSFPLRRPPAGEPSQGVLLRILDSQRGRGQKGGGGG